ncbi:MAG TPA: amino acid--tRNA ligase-related protein [Tepidisphaeraceae bacterium]|jgi:lysyl-tRNA synthetase class 2|nr:amino acid--tRNA ligase-related protein [Tepidisphaeraceae bacterium]
MEQPANQYEQERRQKMQKLRELGVDPFGGRVEGVQSLAAVRSLHKPEFGQDGGPIVKVAGRMVFVRDMGKLWFVRLRDETGELQIALDKKRLSEREWNVVKLLDLGDQIVAEGPLGATKTGEVTIWTKLLTIASKSLLPPPEKYQGLTDVEIRYRQRYVDLFTNPDVMRVLKLRSEVVAEIRRYMTNLGYTEVETPMMQSLAGGAAARPFTTHHNALDIDLYLRIAPELYLKRLLVGGFRKVFELNRNFRNEGISPRHNPEFTMLEAYEAYGSWETMADMVEGMICHLAEKLFGGLRLETMANGSPRLRKINLEGDLTKPPGKRWRRVRLVDLVAETTSGQWHFDQRDIRDASPMATAHLFDRYRGEKGSHLGDSTANWEVIHEAMHIGPRDEESQLLLLRCIKEGPENVAPSLSPHMKLIITRFSRMLDEMKPAEQLVMFYEKLVEPYLIDPCFVTHIPGAVIPLAKKSRDDTFFADVYELAINGQEISPGYTELNDPDVQAENFKHQVGDKEEQQKVDEDFLTALRYGMPPAGGMGLGIDRLVMMLTGADSIRDVILFPLMKPQE